MIFKLRVDKIDALLGEHHGTSDLWYAIAHIAVV